MTITKLVRILEIHKLEYVILGKDTVQVYTNMDDMDMDVLQVIDGKLYVNGALTTIAQWLNY